MGPRCPPPPSQRRTCLHRHQIPAALPRKSQLQRRDGHSQHPPSTTHHASRNTFYLQTRSGRPPHAVLSAGSATPHHCATTTVPAPRAAVWSQASKAQERASPSPDGLACRNGPVLGMWTKAVLRSGGNLRTPCDSTVTLVFWGAKLQQTAVPCASFDPKDDGRQCLFACCGLHIFSSRPSSQRPTKMMWQVYGLSEATHPRRCPTSQIETIFPSRQARQAYMLSFTFMASTPMNTKKCVTPR